MGTQLRKDTAPLSPRSSLGEGCIEYLERRKPFLKPRSVEQYEYYFRTLRSFFPVHKPLASFHEGDLREYQKWRTESGPNRRQAGSSVINHELSALAQVLALANLWDPIARYYKRLPQKVSSRPKVLSEEEEDRFFRVAQQRPEWKMALHAARLTLNTTLAGCELRMLQLDNLQLEQNPPIILAPKVVKNNNRVRSIPLNSQALESIRELVKEAKLRGSSEPTHFVFPFRLKKGQYDPCRPASPNFVRSAFRAIARSCGLNWVTPSLFRHQSITKLLENGAPDETVRAIAGHGTEKAIKYYSHIRIEAKKAAVDRLVLPLGPTKSDESPGKSFSLVARLREKARQLGIAADAAIELILFYERTKGASS